MISKIIVIGWSIFTAWSILSGLHEGAKYHAMGGADVVFVFIMIAMWAVVVVPVVAIGVLFKKRQRQ